VTRLLQALRRAAAGAAALALLLATPAALAQIPGKVSLVQQAGAWVAYKPDGSVLSTAGSQCGGLPEAMNFAIQNGHEFEAVGGGQLATNVYTATIGCNASINLLPMQGARLVVGAINVEFAPSVQYGVVFDTMLHSTLAWYGRIVFRSGNGGAAVLFSPRAAFPQGSPPLIVDNRVHFQRVLFDGGAGSPAGAVFSTNEGSIARNRISFTEIEGGAGATAYMGDGLQVWRSGAGHAFSGNELEVNALLIWSGAAIRVGLDGQGSGPLERNRWRVTAENSATGGVALSTHASHDFYLLSFRAAYGPPYGALLHAGTTGNVLVRHRLDGGVVNNGSGNAVIP